MAGDVREEVHGVEMQTGGEPPLVDEAQAWWPCTMLAQVMQDL